MSSVIIVAGFAFIMAIIFAVIGVRAAKVRSDRLAFWNSAKNWPSVSGKLLEVGIDVITKRRNVEDRLLSDTYYRPRIAYSYSVGGRAHKGARFDCSESLGDTQIRTRARISKYSPGDSADIAYDPDDPDNSVLARGNKPEAGEGLLSIYLGFSSAIFLVAMGVRILT